MLKHPVPEEHLKHIGEMAVCFALLELVIQTLIGSSWRQSPLASIT